MSLKLQVFLAHAGIASRRKAEVLIEQGKVVVNGQRATIGQRIDPRKDEVTVGGKPVQKKSEETYVLINKPRGIISTTDDELNRKTVLSLVSEIKVRLYPVGRLDKDSEGLMLLTTDGELTFTFTHPSQHVEKTYEVLVQGKPTPKALNLLRSGVKLKEGFTKPAQVEIMRQLPNSTWLSITISEGHNHQVRRMLFRVGYETLRLIRTRMGPFTLEMLSGKQKRVLSAEEVRECLDQANLSVQSSG